MELVKLLGEVLGDFSDVKVSQLTGIERTRINRIRNGKFKIDFSELNKIINTFAVSESKKRELYDRYLFEKLGSDKYNSRMLAKRFLSSLQPYNTENDDIFESSVFQVRAEVDLPEDVVVLNNSVSVGRATSLILTEAAQNNDPIMIISSPMAKNLLHTLLSISSGSRSLEIKHIYMLPSINELTEPLTYYMEVASAVYPIFMMNTNYKAYYTMQGYNTNALTPFGIITSKYVLIISNDESCGYIIRSKSVAELSKKLYKQRVKQSIPFVKKISTPGEFLEHYGRVMETSANSEAPIYYTLDYEPCMLHFFSETDLQMMIQSTKDMPAVLALLEKIETSLLPIFNKQKQVAFFTKDGVRSFIKTGQIAEIPEGLGLKFTYQRRRELLQLVLDTMKDPGDSPYVYKMINENEFDPPSGLRFLGCGASTDHMFVMSDSADGVRSILSLTNPDIISSVFDFIESLEESNMLYSDEEMIAFMEDAIANM